VLQVVLIDASGSADVVAALESLVNAKGKPLKVGLIERAADLADVRTYQAALRGLGSQAALADCLLVVDADARAEAAQRVQGLGLLRVRVHEVAGLPLLVAARIGADSLANLERALGWFLRARYGLDLTSVVSSTPERIAFRALAWRVVEGDELGDVSGVRAPFAVEGLVTCDGAGRVESLQASEPSDDQLTEARNFVASLLHHGQLQAQRAGSSHEIVTDAQGQRRLVRLRTGSH
jgi:hypothetical protein